MIHDTVDWDIAIIRYDVPVPPNTGQPAYRQHSRDSAAAILVFEIVPMAPRDREPQQALYEFAIPFYA